MVFCAGEEEGAGGCGWCFLGELSPLVSGSLCWVVRSAMATFVFCLAVRGGSKLGWSVSGFDRRHWNCRHAIHSFLQLMHGRDELTRRPGFFLGLKAEKTFNTRIRKVRRDTGGGGTRSGRGSGGDAMAAQAVRSASPAHPQLLVLVSQFQELEVARWSMGAEPGQEWKPPKSVDGLAPNVLRLPRPGTCFFTA